MRNYGWLPDTPDHRDFTFTVKKRLKALPSTTDLRKRCPPVYDQGEIASSTANAIAGAYEIALLKSGVTDFTPSRLGLYYDIRTVEGNTQSDSGAQIRTGIKVLVSQGIYPESLWHYGAHKLHVKPPSECYARVRKDSLVYERVPRSVEGFCGALSEGHPFVFGLSVYSAYESETLAETGVLYPPRKNEAFLGGHTVLAVGYSLKTKRILVRDSRGPNWGKGGYFTVPMDYLLNQHLADDFWVLRQVE